MAALQKDTSNMIQCRISECIPQDRFITGTWGNQGTYKITGQDLMGNREIKSIQGDCSRTITPNKLVWRNKRMTEALGDGRDIIAEMFQAPKQSDPTPEPKPKSNRLVDIIDCDNEISAII